MKKVFLAFLLTFLCSQAKAVEVWKSSTTAASQPGYNFLCPNRAVFHGICTGFGVASASTTIVASSWTYNTTTGNVNGTGPISTFVADQCKYYDIGFTNGMGYQKGNVANVTIFYTCY